VAVSTASVGRSITRRRVGADPPPVLELFDVDTSPVPLEPTRLRAGQVALGVAFVLLAATASLVSGPAGLSDQAVLEDVIGKLPLVHLHSGLSATGAVVVFQLRLPRIVLGGIVGAMLALSGASYQGVFSNALADPYLLGVASGAGLGATLAVVEGPHLHLGTEAVPIAAFLGATLAVLATFALGRSRSGGRGPAPLLLAGIAVAAFFTAAQTFLQQQNAPDLQVVYSWILGGLSTAGWGQVSLVLPYVVVAAAVMLACRHLLDVMSVGDEESTAVGVRADLVRLAVITAATLGTAAVVAVSGLIGFVGIIVPHAIRLVAGPSYARILPLSVLFGAGFLILCDLLARSVLSPAEIPIGVVTAFLGAPFFLVVLRQARRLS
jgi:iron complex transport system permease protein